MKNKALTFTVTAIMLLTGFSSIGQENNENKKARKNLVEAQKDLTEAKKDSVADFEKFKKESEATIKENQIKIAELKLKKSSNNKEADDKYNKKVAALETKNNKLKSKIENCDNTKTTAWASFKKEFNHDITELGHAIKDIGVDNK